MPFASRFDVSLDNGKTLMALLTIELAELNTKHPKGFSIRLHVLGDFFSVDYVEFWRRQLSEYPGLRIFGYTHRRGDIRDAIDSVFEEHYGRFVVLQSDSLSETRPSALIEGIHPDAGNYVLCPEQAQQVNSCLECGICTSPSIRGVRFARH